MKRHFYTLCLWIPSSWLVPLLAGEAVDQQALICPTSNKLFQVLEVQTAPSLLLAPTTSTAFCHGSVPLPATDAAPGRKRVSLTNCVSSVSYTHLTLPTKRIV